MKTPAPASLSRREVVIGLRLMVAGLLIASCETKSPPAPGSWQEEYARRKAKYREWGQGTSTK